MVREIITVVVLLAAVAINVYAFFRWKDKFVSKDDFKPEEYIKVANCKACKEDMKVTDKEVKDDIKNIKIALVDEVKDIKTLGVIQIAMCRHVGMKKEEIDMFKDAIENGTDVSSLL